MRARILITPIVIGCFLLTASIAAAALQLGDDERELVWTCPVHREVTEDDAGQCEFCERELVPTLVQLAWSCPIHSVVVERDPGQCPICRRDLYLISEEVRYACPMHPEENSHEPGNCSVCNMALVESTSIRPHQDHNPKHGGMFFMAPDNWHHLEGTYPEDGIFRIYLYDNFSEPMNASSFNGRAVLQEERDPDTGEIREVVAYPLLPSPDGAYLEAQVGSAPLPREITAKLQFEESGEIDRFDFVFADLSRDVEITTDASVSNGDELVIPDSPSEIAGVIEEKNLEVRELVTSGALNQIYLPALQAKDLAVALEAHVGGLPARQRREIRWALKQLVRSAWLLDDYGDLGNREKVLVAYDWFDEAVETIGSIYP